MCLGLLLRLLGLDAKLRCIVRIRPAHRDREIEFSPSLTNASISGQVSYAVSSCAAAGKAKVPATDSNNAVAAAHLEILHFTLSADTKPGVFLVVEVRIMNVDQFRGNVQNGIGHETGSFSEKLK